MSASRGLAPLRGAGKCGCILRPVWQSGVRRHGPWFRDHLCLEASAVGIPEARMGSSRRKASRPFHPQRSHDPVRNGLQQARLRLPVRDGQRKGPLAGPHVEDTYSEIAL